MPSKSKKQLNLFKLVKAYTDNGFLGLNNLWGKLYPNRKLSDYEIEKIENISKTINYSDLEDMASGIVGDESFGDSREFKVGYWMKFEAWYLNYKGEKNKNTFITKISRVRPDIKLVNFNSDELYNKNGIRISPVKRSRITDLDNVWLDFAYFDQIKETAKTKDELVMKNEIRKMVRNLLSETFESEGLKIKKRNSNEEVNVKTGMLVQKKSDESKGKIKNVGINHDTIPAKNNINIEWYHGDLAGTSQTINPEDIEAI